MRTAYSRGSWEQEARGQDAFNFHHFLVLNYKQAPFSLKSSKARSEESVRSLAIFPPSYFPFLKTYFLQAVYLSHRLVFISRFRLNELEILSCKQGTHATDERQSVSTCSFFLLIQNLQPGSTYLSKAPVSIDCDSYGCHCKDCTCNKQLWKKLNKIIMQCRRLEISPSTGLKYNYNIIKISCSLLVISQSQRARNSQT